ncbi:MAG: PqqD family protein [Candidatus Binatus sp.]|uniref:PqqD family protein n=1 Tax=Candidatus Binatus sp. TaxID=2811406 RepID=UPI00272936F3|nr:PqqD family protein [Candidatus Binatus sp.]MDO8432469.1 PqqD family protein [Candidatus Binatus sp.]
MPTDFTIVVSKYQVSRDLAEEAVILNTRSGIYYGLDSVGARVWNLMRQPRKFSEICQFITAEYDVAPASCARDLRELLDNLHAYGLIEIDP